MFKKNYYILAGIFFIGLLGSLIAAKNTLFTSETKQKEIAESGQATIAAQAMTETVLYLGKDSSVYEYLIGAGLNPSQIASLVETARTEVDFARLPSGTQITILQNDALIKIGIHLSPMRIAWLSSHLDTAGEPQNEAGQQPENLNREEPAQVANIAESAAPVQPAIRMGAWDLAIEEKTPTRTQVAYEGSVQSSLWESAVALGLDGDLISKLTEIFAWQIDFDRQSQPGDKWTILIEKLTLDEKHCSWGEIALATYELQGDKYTALKFSGAPGKEGYYDLEGQSLKGKFLKSPLKYGRVSSFFAHKRFHPILGVSRPHLGVDYAAPTGTPVRAVGDGIITKIGGYGGNGNMITLKHNSHYQTAYKHLSRYASGLRVGSEVSQGQVIAYVGSTGLATGPHLHFEFYENGQFVDPLGKKFPRQEALSPKLMPSFLTLYEQTLQVMQKKLVSNT